MATAYTNYWRNSAYTIAQSWQDAPKAIELLDRALTLHELQDAATGFTGILDAIGDTLIDVECDLDALRQDAIDTALGEWEGESDEYTRDHLSDFALTVSKAIAARRTYVRDTRLVPVSRLSLGSVAA